jgi:hypothetical protein
VVAVSSPTIQPQDARLAPGQYPRASDSKRPVLRLPKADLTFPIRGSHIAAERPPGPFLTGTGQRLARNAPRRPPTPSPNHARATKQENENA